MTRSPLSVGNAQDTSSAGLVGSLNSVRVTVGAAGWPASRSTTLIVRLATAGCSWTVQCTWPV